MKSIKQRIAYLREQPEPVRLRVATLLTAGSGALLVVLWLAILLPLQIKLNSPASPAASEVAIPLPTGRQPLSSPATAGVAGVRTATPVPQSPVATISPSPSASPIVSEVAPLGLPTSSVEP